jgi:Kef-type K+ transport system membrane component KefB
MDAHHVFLYLLADLVLIIVAARSFGVLARRLGQPSVIGEVVAGILLGPTVLGRIHADLPGMIFPKEVLDAMKPIADLGLVFFMFLVGLEMDTSLMRKEFRKSVLISVSGILLPFVLGMLVAWMLAPVNNEGNFLPEIGDKRPAPFTFALFLGASMCITAFPILARFLVETGLYKTAVGTSALCAAAVDDAIAWILLAAVIGITKTGSPADAVPALLLTGAFAAFMFTVGRYLLELLAKRYDRTGSLSIDQVALIIAGVLLSAWATEKIGIHAIFGAFIFGVIMPKRSGMVHALTDKIEDFTVIVLLPIFFAIVGLKTNLLTLNNPALIGWLMLILLAATVGKFLGTGLTAYLTGSSPRDAVVVGSLMNTRGLTELVILSIGLSLGVLSDVTFAMMVIMALVTTVMAAPIVNRLIPRQEMTGNLVRSATGAAESATPPAVRILVAIGNPLNAPALVRAAIYLAGQRRPAELLLVKLIPSPRAPEFTSGIVALDRQIAEAVAEMQPLVALAAEAGVTARPVSFLTENVGMDIARVAADMQCNAVVLGWMRALLNKDLLQALVHRVFVAAPCDVVVFVDRAGRGMPTAESRPVLAVLNGDANDTAACSIAGQMAQKLSVPVRIAGYLHDPTAATRSIEQRIEDLQKELHVPTESAPLPSPKADAFVSATSQAAVAVLGVGDDWVMRQDFGQPTNDLAERAECPLFILRAANWLGTRPQI